jgi:nitrous oxidase accessory protein
MRWGLWALAFLLLIWRPSPTVRAAGPELPSQALQERIDAAPPGATLEVEGGTYMGPISLHKPIHLVGKGWPVIDGREEGDVVTITASGASISGFVIRGSSWSPSQEPAVVKVKEAKQVTVRGNRIENSFFGIYLIDADEAMVEGNQVSLAPHRPVSRRGHGVYAWETSEAIFRGNVISYTSDGFYLDHSDSNAILDNTVRHGRFGIHLMYSDDVEVIGNILRENLAGVVQMFSHRLLVQRNEISDHRGASGVGILVKDSDDLFVVDNKVVGNVYGITADGSPQSVGSTVVFQRNLLASNQVGIGLMPNAPISVFENAFVDNGIQVQALGRGVMSRLMAVHGGGGAHHHHAVQEEPVSLPAGVALASEGHGNYWSDYRGYDLDGDGVGDIPYRLTSLFARLSREQPLASAFLYTLAHEALGVAERLFPMVGAGEVLEDPAPLMEPPLALGGDGEGPSLAMVVVSLAMVGLPVYLALSLRPPWRRRHAHGA